jgi:hypothetical protein
VVLGVDGWAYAVEVMGELRVSGKDVKVVSKDARAKIEKRENVKREKVEVVKGEADAQ